MKKHSNDLSTPESLKTCGTFTNPESKPTGQLGEPHLSGREITPQMLRDTEEQIRQLWEAGELPYLIHLMGGNEDWLCEFWRANIRPTDWVFASHRAHFHYVLHGGDDLVEKVKAGKSMFLYRERFVNSAIVAGTPAIAAGVARDIQLSGGDERVWCFVGDGAEDEGHFYEAVRHVHALGLPCTFIIEDNNGSCGVTKKERGSPQTWNWPPCVIRHEYTMRWPHAGSGVRPTLKRCS